MSIFKPAPTPVADPPLRDPEVCLACRRSGIPMEATLVETLGQRSMCANPSDCRRHWPAESLSYGRTVEAPEKRN